MSKAFDTVNIHTITHKQTSHTTLSNTSQTTSKDAKHTPHSETKLQHNANSKMVFHKAAFYHPNSSTYTHLTPVKLTTYEDNITITSTHNDINIAKANIQSYLHEIHTWAQTNNLILNTDKTTCTLFTPDPAEYSTQLELQIDNITLPMNITPKILGLTLNSKLTYNKHIEITTTKARKTIQILKPLT